MTEERKDFNATALVWFLDDTLRVELGKKRNEKRRDMLNKVLEVCTGCAGNLERDLVQADGEPFTPEMRRVVASRIFQCWSFLEDAMRPHPDMRLRFFQKVGCRLGDAVPPKKEI